MTDNPGVTGEAVRRTWALEVCSTCGAIARWPFCSHRDAYVDAGSKGRPWYQFVTVSGTWRPNGDH